MEKEIVDEVIFKTINPRGRLMFELMARRGMRIGEVLKLTPKDVYGWTPLHLASENGHSEVGISCICSLR